MTIRKKCALLFAPVLVACGGLTVSCVSSRHTAEPPVTSGLVWPHPPDEPRIRYVKNISSPADIGRSPSAWKRALSLITGDSGERQTLAKPFGVALDESGNLCLSDTGNNTVCYCDLARKPWRSWASVGKTRFASPVAVASKDC